MVITTRLILIVPNSIGELSAGLAIVLDDVYSCWPSCLD